MSDHATEQIVIAASPQRCYEVAADIEAYPTWISDVKAVIAQERDAEGRPVLAEFRAAAFGRSTTYTLRYDFTGGPARLAWELTESDLVASLEGTYTYDLSVALKVPIPGFVKSRAEHRIRQTALQELKARVESTS